MSELWLVRHGETEWSASGRHTSVTDLDLTDDGVAVAGALAGPLSQVDFALVLTSPRRRARRTAELAGFAHAEVDDDLVEWAYGEYEGVTTADIRKTVPDWTIWTSPVPGGETADEVAARLQRVVDRARATDGRTLVFGHSHALRVLTTCWLGLGPQEGRHFYLDTATYSVLGDDRGEPVVRRWNVALERPGAAAENDR